MNEKQIEKVTATENTSDQATSAPAKKPAKRGGPRTLSGGLALILTLVALILSGYLWYMLTEKMGLFDIDVVGKLEQLENSVDTLQTNAAIAEEDISALKETQETVKSAIDKLNADVGKARIERTLAETEQLLVIANHRLQLARDVNLALITLRAADSQLKQLANPNLLPVRKILAEEISQLEALERVDIPGLALRLNSMANRIDKLPLAMDTRFKKTETTEAKEPEKPIDATWRQFFREIWKDFINLIRIRNSAETRKPLLAPEQYYFLRENLRLMLYGAQLALLERNEAVYKQNLKSADQWIGEYFDNTTQVIISMRKDLEKMLKTPLRGDVPDISASLQALRKATAKTGDSP
jgi:uroporphyrin-III C-methyltransferase